jgi:cell division protein FtsW
VGKFLYLPSGYNDFIYSIVGEELGFVGSLIVIGLFIVFGVEGFRIALNQEDKIKGLIAGGFTFVICFQALLNFSVTLGLLPVTGLTLPFISYGGSSLIVSLAMVGCIVNIGNS